jgi:hypothetical protein
MILVSKLWAASTANARASVETPAPLLALVKTIGCCQLVGPQGDIQRNSESFIPHKCDPEALSWLWAI